MAKGCTNNKYEEAKQKRLKENKKGFEDSGISRISKKLTGITSSAKKTPHHSPKLKPKTNGLVEPRRSSRVRNPVPSYRDDVSIDLLRLGKGSRSSCGRYISRPPDEIKEVTEQERNCALEAAEALQINLKSSNPSFIKSMVHTHVYSCYWLGLPSSFCEEHLPKTMHDIILEDENGFEYEAVYSGQRHGISGGWRAFALDHNLDDGDAIVFELIEDAKFKIYIVRAFPDSVKGNMRATKSPKVARNCESEFNKKKKPKRAILYETKESESSQQNLPESGSDNDVKPQRVNRTKKTKFSGKKTQKNSKLPATAEPKGEAVAKTEKPKTSIKLSNKTRKSNGGMIGDSGNAEEFLSENIPIKPRGANPGKNQFVQDADSKLEKVEPVGEASKSVSQNPRKKRALKFFRKKSRV